MKPVIIDLTETNGWARDNEPVCIGIPLKRGLVLDSREVTLSDGNQEAVNHFHARPMSNWPDGSIKWLQLDFLAKLDGHAHRSLQLCQITDNSTNGAASSDNAEQPVGVDVRLAAGELELRHHNTVLGGATLSIDITDATGNIHPVHMRSVELCPSSNSVRRTRLCEGSVELNGQILNLKLRILTYADSGKIRVDTCVHNPNATKHLGGYWDLGDTGSVLFRACSVHLSPEDADAVSLLADFNEQPIDVAATDQLSIEQFSSGGENWLSKVHVDASNEVPHSTRGYTVQHNGKIINTGMRATPVVQIQCGRGNWLAGIGKFWQNFPTALSWSDQVLTANLFSESDIDTHELQGGEKKWQTIHLELQPAEDVNSDQLANFMAIHSPLVPKLDPRHWDASGVVPDYCASAGDTALDQLVAGGVEGDNSFFKKRELIDEYGWRNFGDIFADHESLYAMEKGEPLLISHYNNQYDATGGFFVQFVNSGDSRWFELMDDLARHVTDIDIYDTEKDRVEFNGGLFWHTDHYADARTASHRTYSRRQLNAEGQPATIGGGPGSEHCYTTGLVYHYYLTGETNSRDAVLKMADWMKNMHEGAPGILAALDSVRKEELGKIKGRIKKESSSPYRYAFTRATGYYIVALLDAYELSGDRQWIQTIERVIPECMHPSDSYESRGFDNIEFTWYYTILLQALTSYLTVKEELGEKDDHYEFARSSLVHYLSYMLEHETLYFDNVDKLEFPNATWIVQEIRKCNLMITGSRYEPSRASEYLASAQMYLDYLETELSTHAETSFTRIQIILLQNYCLANSLRLKSANIPGQIHDSPVKNFGPVPEDTIPNLFVSAMQKLFKGVRQFSFAGEKAWVTARLDSHRK